MFDDQPTDQQHNMNNDGTGGITVPPLSLGVNPATSPQNGDGAAAPAPVAPTVVLPTQADDAAQATPTAPAAPVSPAAASGPLEDMKREALAQLSPLVKHLEQSPEEKYKTLMMMIQASDNQDLLSEAYENAQKISDEKTKAEALLNIVNEINYFSQKEVKSS